MSSTGHPIRDPFLDRSHRLIAQLLPVQRQRRHGCAPGTSAPGQGFQNPCRNGGLCIRESIHQIVKLCSGRCFHGPNLAHPSRSDPMVRAGKRRRRTADDPRVTLSMRESGPGPTASIDGCSTRCRSPRPVPQFGIRVSPRGPLFTDFAARFGTGAQRRGGRARLLRPRLRISSGEPRALMSEVTWWRGRWCSWTSGGRSSRRPTASWSGCMNEPYRAACQAGDRQEPMVLWEQVGHWPPWGVARRHRGEPGETRRTGPRDRIPLGAVQSCADVVRSST